MCSERVLLHYWATSTWQRYGKLCTNGLPHTDLLVQVWQRSLKRGKENHPMRRPGIEPGSAPWQGAILPLDHRRTMCPEVASSAIKLEQTCLLVELLRRTCIPDLGRPCACCRV